MDSTAAKTLRIGAWRADPLKSTLTKGDEVVQVDERAMRLLLSLAARAGQIVSVDKLLDEVWGDVVVSPDSVYQAVASLRRTLGDDAKNPTYIATVPRLGYRMVAAVSDVLEDPPHPVVDSAPHWGTQRGIDQTGDFAAVVPPTGGRSVWLRVAGGILLALLLGCGIFVYERGQGRAVPPRSVAVLPFIDLTSQSMDEEYFADGMTQELIDRLSHVPGLRVLPVKGVDKVRGVAYVLDGSVRKSESKMRITARLARVSDGYVVWSQSYDRSPQDKLEVQEDIARQVSAVFRGFQD